MKRIAKLSFLLVAVALLAPACGTSSAGAPSFVGRSATSGDPAIAWLATLPAISGISQTITVYDTTRGGTFRQREPGLHRILVSCRFDQPVTILYQVERTGSSTWRTMNGNGSGDAVAASTDTFIDYLVLGPDSRLQIVTGGTGPTTAELDVGLVYERQLAL